MRKEKRNVFSVGFTLLMLISSMFASLIAVAPAAYAEIGVGGIVSYSPKVIVEGEGKDIVVTLVNNDDDPQEVVCIDEIIITAPDNWGGVANVESVTNLGDYDWQNMADTGDYINLVNDDQSVRITPKAIGGVPLCENGVTTITISGLTAPLTDGGELSKFMILTSDTTDSNPPGPTNWIRYPILSQDSSCSGFAATECSFAITVSEAREIKAEYLEINSFAADTPDYRIKAKAHGAWAKMTELYVLADQDMTVDVYMDLQQAVSATYSGSEPKIASSVNLNGGFNVIPLTDYDTASATHINEGYVKISQEAVYYIDITAGLGTQLTLKGHADVFAPDYMDPTYTGTGFSTPPEEGSVIGIEDFDGSGLDSLTEREVKIQLVSPYEHAGNTYMLDVDQTGLPIMVTTTLGTLIDLDGPAPGSENTNSDGSVLFKLRENNVAGTANVEACLSDPIDCETEKIGINAGTPVSFDIVKGTDGTMVEAGDIQEIEVVVKDAHGNKITNNPAMPYVTYTIMSEPDADALDASLDSDANPGNEGKSVSEQTEMGIGDAFLQTSEKVGAHEIQVCVEGIAACQTTTIYGVLGQADAIECTVLDVVGQVPTVTADQCFDVLVQVVDSNGNPLPKWESVVGVELLNWANAPKGSKYINDTDMREEDPELPDGFTTKVKGKLNNADLTTPYAWAIVEVCGCSALGQFDIACRTDTLEDDLITLDVRNSEMDCIDVDLTGNQCDDDNWQVHTTIVDTCANPIVGENCGGANANSCVELSASCGTLSTPSTCVDLFSTGMAPIVDLNVEGCPCGDISVTATDVADCCLNDYETLEMCDSASLSKVGPATHLKMEVYPEASNQDDFFASERTVAEFTLLDDCQQVVYCGSDELDLELKGQDCADTSLQVDSPYLADGETYCEGEVLCNAATTWGQDKCEETTGCAWEATGTECVGDLVCDPILTQNLCEAVGCEWSTETDRCGNIPVDDCEDFDPAQCEEFQKAGAGCFVQDVFTCEGAGADDNDYGSCENYNEYQCNNVGLPDDCTDGDCSPSCDWVGEVCEFGDEAVHKVVIENCNEGSKAAGNKEWTDLPEKDDLVIDKIAFDFNGPTYDGIKVCVYEETEATEGFQPAEDYLWKCAELAGLPTVPSSDADTDDNAAFDEIHGLNQIQDGYGDIYYIELDDRIEKSQLGEYDNQRMGGAIVEPGDTKDFYIVLSTTKQVPCGEYDADYLFYEDYNSPDFIEWSPDNKDYTHVIDTLEGSEEYTRRNDDYTGSDPYPVTDPDTRDYGFGDTVLHNLVLAGGKAKAIFRDLVSETVIVKVLGGYAIDLVETGKVTEYTEDSVVKGANITFHTQPATQVVARNHGDLAGDGEICDDEMEECRAAMACSDEGYDINLQITDGFQNQVKLGTEVQLHSCLTYPKKVRLTGNLIPGIDQDIEINFWSEMGLDESSDPWDTCFDMKKFKSRMLEIMEEEIGPHDQFRESFVASQEFDWFIHELFEGLDVEFVEVPGYPLGVDAAGHTIVTTDHNGRAKVRVESDDASMFRTDILDASFRVFFVPHALDADYLDVDFVPGEPAEWNIIAIPSVGVVADGEQEARLFIRKFDACENPVDISSLTENVNVIAYSQSGRAIISKDFNGENNYDNMITGDISNYPDMKCAGLWPWFENCGLEVMNDVIEFVDVVIESTDCTQTQDGHCVQTPDPMVPPGSFGCESRLTEQECEPQGSEACTWMPETVCQKAGWTGIQFVGAPVKLKIVDIIHSDLIPADGYEMSHGVNLPMDACTKEDNQDLIFSLNGLGDYSEMCHKDCVQYGNTGAWVTVEVKDKFGNRVAGYLGDGLKGDPGDVYGNPDYVAERICIGLDDPRAFIEDYTFGFMDLKLESADPNGKVYCGDLAYGRGAVKVSYHMLDMWGQPLDPRETEKVVVSVFDMCDRDEGEKFGILEGKWDDQCNGQEYDENNLPDSETASRLEPDSGKLIYTSVPDRWDIEADKVIVSADGKDYAQIMVNVENEYMDVRASLDATVQSSLLGSKLESEAITPGCYNECNAISDPLNPTSINVMTEDCSGGRAMLKLSSTEPGVARVTVTGNGFGCKEWVTGNQYTQWFELTFGEGYMESLELEGWVQGCVEDWDELCTIGWASVDCEGSATEVCAGLAMSYEQYWYQYQEMTLGMSMAQQSELYTPYCLEWGVIPLTPKTIEVEFQQAFQDEIVLEEGWNFFSVPYELDAAGDQWSELGLNTKCVASASWDDQAKTFVAPVPAGEVLTSLEGYWCKAAEAATIPVEKADLSNGVFLPIVKTIYPGWNDVGLANHVAMKMEHALISIDSVYTQLLDWLEGLQRFATFANTGELGGGDVPGTTGTDEMKAGQGYFIWSPMETGEEAVLAGQS